MNITVIFSHYFEFNNLFASIWGAVEMCNKLKHCVVYYHNGHRLTPHEIVAFNDALSQKPLLKTFELDCNFDQQTATAIEIVKTLPLLEKLTLNVSGSDFVEALVNGPNVSLSVQELKFNKKISADALPNLVNFFYQFNFIDFASCRPVGFKLGFFRFDQTIELEQDLSVGKAIIFDSHLVKGQLLVFVNLVNGIGFAGGLEISDNYSTRFVLFD